MKQHPPSSPSSTSAPNTQPPSVELSAVEFKDQGNKYYSLHKYDEAIACYTRAIIRNPTVATFFTNRGLCYLKLGQWDLSVADCKRALEMDPNLIKGHFFLGQALIEQQHYDDAMKHLQRAQDLAKDQKLNFGDEIAYQLRLARKKKWNQIEDKRIKEEIELQSYLHQLILKDREERIQKARLMVSTDHHSDNTNGDEDDVGSSTSCLNRISSESNVDSDESDVQLIANQCDNYRAQLDSLFSQNDMRRKKRDVPDYLCGKISFEIMKDPVVTPSGITYDRRDIEEHLQRVGHFDPVTRQHLTMDKVIPNLAMKDVVDAFLADNEWANEY